MDAHRPSPWAEGPRAKPDQDVGNDHTFAPLRSRRTLPEPPARP